MNYTPAYDEELDDDVSSPYYRSRQPLQQRDGSNQGVMIALGLIIIALLGLIVYLVSDRLYPTDATPLVVNLDQPRTPDEDNSSLLDLEVSSGQSVTGLSLSGETLSGANTGLNTSGSALISQDQLAFISQVFGQSAYLKQQLKSDTFTASDGVILTVNPLDSTQTLETPSIQIGGMTNGQISSVLVAHFDANRDLQKIYKLQNFKPGDQERLSNLSPNNQNILPGPNRYYIIATDTEGINHVATFALKAPSGETYEREWTRRCIGDVCTEPNIKLIKQTDGSYTQKTTTKEITFKPDEYITINALDYSLENIQARRLGDNTIIKTTSYIDDGDDSPLERVSQSIKTLYGAPIQNISDVNIPQRFSYGNISYTNPVVNFAQPTQALLFTLSTKPNNSTLEQFVTQWETITPQLLVEVSKGIYAQYTLSRNQWNIFDPTAYDAVTNKLNGFRVIPKVADRMKDRVAYAVVEPSMEQQIIQQVGRVEKQTNCNTRRFAGGNTGAKFVLYPVNSQYDIVATTNCRGVAQ